MKAKSWFDIMTISVLCCKPLYFFEGLLMFSASHIQKVTTEGLQWVRAACMNSASVSASQGSDSSRLFIRLISVNWRPAKEDSVSLSKANLISPPVLKALSEQTAECLLISSEQVVLDTRLVMENAIRNKDTGGKHQTLHENAYFGVSSKKQKQ